jgi:hypothetical protein
MPIVPGFGLSPLPLPSESHDFAEGQVDLADVDDDVLALALRSVSWNARDVGHFLRAHRLS